MDGLLFNTEVIYFECYKKAAKEKGAEFSEELFESCVGISQTDAARLIRHHFGPQFDVSNLHARTYAHFETYLSEGGKTYPGNPNGSDYNVAGICSADGRHLAMMPPS